MDLKDYHFQQRKGGGRGMRKKWQVCCKGSLNTVITVRTAKRTTYYEGTLIQLIMRGKKKAFYHPSLAELATNV